MKTLAVLSMLHQEDGGSAARMFRGEPVLGWTLRRLDQSSRVENRVVVCWDDQLEGVKPLADQHGVSVFSKGPRTQLPGVEVVAAARRWADGWRGGLLGACCFDLGFHAATVEQLRGERGCDAVVLVDPDSGLVDPNLVDGVIAQAGENGKIEYCFSPAAPGASAVVIKASLLGRLAACDGTLGRMMSYWPDLPGRDPIAAEACAAVPMVVARTTQRLTLDSARQVNLLERATASLNGQLISTGAEALIHLAKANAKAPFPRDVVLELNTTRATRPVHLPATHLPIEREPLQLDTAQRLFAELGRWDDVRLTLAGVGDPMLHECLLDVIEAARQAGIRAIHVETDFVGIPPEKAAALADLSVDAVTLHVPALTAATYASVMGVDALAEVLANTRAFIARRDELGKSTPLLVPTFTKIRQNLAEMEPWYDHWLRVAGCAVINGASDCAGAIPDQSPIDMSPAGRCGCRRLASRVTVLSDGGVTTCEVDVTGQQRVGNIRETSIEELWLGGLAGIRAAHRDGAWAELKICGRCRDWHRP